MSKGQLPSFRDSTIPNLTHIPTSMKMQCVAPFTAQDPPVALLLHLLTLAFQWSLERWATKRTNKIRLDKVNNSKMSFVVNLSKLVLSGGVIQDQHLPNHVYDDCSNQQLLNVEQHNFMLDWVQGMFKRKLTTHRILFSTKAGWSYEKRFYQIDLPAEGRERISSDITHSENHGPKSYPISIIIPNTKNTLNKSLPCGGAKYPPNHKLWFSSLSRSLSLSLSPSPHLI